MAEPRHRILEGMVVRLGPSCNLACRFCPMERRGEPLPLPAVTEQLDAAVAAGAARVLLTGGEPTIRKDLHDVLRAVGERGLRLGLVTNGTTLVYDRLRAGLLRRGLDAVLLLLPALRPGTGDGLVRREGATALALEALGQLCQTPSLTLEVRIPLHDPGGEQALRDLVAHVASTVGKRQGAYVVLEAHAPLRPGGELAPLARSRAAELVVAAVDAAGSLPVYHSGLADCFAGDLARLSIDTAWRPFAPGPAHETCLHEPDATRVTKPLRCSECVSAVRCPGVPAWLAGSEGFAVTRPIPGVRSNSFDFTEAGDLPGFTPGGEDCPGAAQPPARGPLPAVYLVRDGRTTVFTTDTNSFTGDEIREISHRRQQLYIDVSDKVALDDYEQDVRQLRLLPACRPCPRRTACPSAFTVSDEVPFFREERWLRQEIERMKGRILDIGCGDLRYREILHRLVDAGDVEYHGLDPDPEAVARLRTSRIPMQLHVMDIEDFDHPPGYFDYVLMLRSLNHFRDLGRTFDLVSRLLRNHGNLILTECLPFGLLRSRGKTAEARESLVPRFEHFRNWSSEQLLAFLKQGGYPFRVNVHRPVQPKTANMWLLKLIKIDP